MPDQTKRNLIWRVTVYEDNRPVAFSSFGEKEKAQEWLNNFNVEDVLKEQEKTVIKEMEKEELRGIDVIIRTTNDEGRLTTDDIEEAKKFLDYYDSEDFHRFKW